MSGKAPWFNDAWKVVVRAGEFPLATSLSKYIGRLSGTAALCCEAIGILH